MHEAGWLIVPAAWFDRDDVGFFKSSKLPVVSKLQSQERLAIVDTGSSMTRSSEYSNLGTAMGRLRNVGR